MPSKVYVNVEDYKLLDGRMTIEDVTKVGLPTIKHKTNTIDVAGMAVAVDMPDTSHMEAMDYTIYHNNGVNCKYLGTPGRHIQEFRAVRQRYTTAKAEVGFESVKYRLVGIHVETTKGDIETGSPIGSTDKYSCVRYEEEINGEVVTIIDAMAGVIKFNGVSYTDSIQNLLR